MYGKVLTVVLSYMSTINDVRRISSFNSTGFALCLSPIADPCASEDMNVVASSLVGNFLYLALGNPFTCFSHSDLLL